MDKKPPMKTGKPRPMRSEEDRDPCGDALFRGKTVIFAINDLEFFLSHRLALGVEGVRRGARVKLIAPYSEGRALLEARGITWIPWDVDRWSANPWEELAAVRTLTMLYRRERPDLVHHVTIKPVIYGSIAARMAGVPAVVNAVPGRGLVFSSTGIRAGIRRRLVEGLYRLALRHPHQITIFQNRGDLEFFVERGIIPADACRLISGSGVDPEVFQAHPLPDGVPVVLFPARLLWAKGIRELVEAARMLRRERVAFRLVVVGPVIESNPDGVPEHQVRAWENEGILEYWGFRTDMPEVLRQAHVVCLPSYGEGIPKALIEAHACARPVVASDIPGCRELVVPGYTGLLVPPRDPQALAAALRSLLADRSLMETWGANARRHMLEGGYTLESVVDQTFDVYASLLSEGAGTRRRSPPAR